MSNKTNQVGDFLFDKRYNALVQIKSINFISSLDLSYKIVSSYTCKFLCYLYDSDVKQPDDNYLIPVFPKDIGFEVYQNYKPISLEKIKKDIDHTLKTLELINFL